MPTDPSKLLDRVLRLIATDTKRIKQRNKVTQLSPRDAQTVCRYATTIAAIKSEKEADDLKRKRKLERLETPELIAEYQRQQEKK